MGLSALKKAFNLLSGSLNCRTHFAIFYVAATEAAHTFLHKPLSICMKFGVFICFAIGAVAIGLVLLDHEHCSGNEGGSGDAHAGHNH